MRYIDPDAYRTQGIIEMRAGQPGISINDYVLGLDFEGDVIESYAHQPVTGYGRYIALVTFGVYSGLGDEEYTSDPLLVTERELTDLANRPYPLKAPALPAVS